MGKVMMEMPMVTRCGVRGCVYNFGEGCHAKAITVGDASRPGCDTYMKSSSPVKETRRIAGVGACKIGDCKFNEDYECVAESIVVGKVNGLNSCLTYIGR